MGETLLKAIRESLARAVLPEAQRERPLRAPSLRATAGAAADPESLREAFVREASALSTQVYSPADAAEALDILLRIVQAKGAEAALAWDETHLPLPGVWGALAAAGVEILDATIPADEASRAARLADLDRAGVGITGALAGLADTSSLALLSGPGRGRLASLLPPVHIALLPVARLHPNMAAFFAAHPDVICGASPDAMRVTSPDVARGTSPDAVRGASNLVFISGPSRTADIEQTLTMGVHGPRELHVVMLAGSE